MANRNTPMGLRLHEQSADGRSEMVIIVDATAVGKNDPIKIAGSAARIGAGPLVKTVSRIASGDAIYGVVQGLVKHEVASANFSLDTNYRPASVNMYAIVRVANNADVYEVQCDDEGSTPAVTDVGLNANLTGNGGGTTVTDCNTSTGVSTVVLDTSTKDTTATLQVHIAAPSSTVDAEFPGTNSKVYVRLNNIQVNGGTGTAGV